MKELELKTIAQVIGARVDGDIDQIRIRAICTDTRTIEKGCLFVAFAGERFDAHAFVAQAAQSGAVAAVCSKPVQCAIPVLYVEDTRTAFLDIAGYYRSLFDIPLVGITGSVGKTTTKEFIALALSAKYHTLKTEGNLNNDVGMPKMLLKLDDQYGAAVIEMGMNHFGEIHALSLRSRPTIGVITNIGVSHIENLGSREGILQAKLELLDGMAQDAPLVLNADNDLLGSVTITDREIIYFGIHSDKAAFRAKDIAARAGATDFSVVYPGGEQRVSIPTVGEHNVLNALCAFAVGMRAGAAPAAIANKLAQYVPAGMRQRVADCGDFTVIEDCYNASPDSMRASLQMLANMRGGKTIAVLADMLELGDYSEQMHRDIGAFAARLGIDVLLCYGAAAKYYCEQAKQEGIACALHVADQSALLDAVLENIEPACHILFKGSHGMHLEKTIQELYERKGVKNE